MFRASRVQRGLETRNARVVRGPLIPIIGSSDVAKPTQKGGCHLTVGDTNSQFVDFNGECSGDRFGKALVRRLNETVIFQAGAECFSPQSSWAQGIQFLRDFRNTWLTRPIEIACDLNASGNSPKERECDRYCDAWSPADTRKPRGPHRRKPVVRGRSSRQGDSPHR